MNGGQILLFLTFMLLISCSSGHGDPLRVLLDPQAQRAAWRLAALDARKRMAHNPNRLDALYRITSDPARPIWQRREAIDQLLMDDRENFANRLLNQTVRIDHWGVWDHLLKRILEQQWVLVTPVVVRRLAERRPWTADRDRLEIAALEELHRPKTFDHVIFDVLNAQTDASDQRPGSRLTLSPPRSVARRDQRLAWQLLNRLFDPKRLRDRIVHISAQSQTVQQLQEAAKVLDVLPRHREGLLWLSYLMRSANSDQWDRTSAIVERIETRNRKGLQLRHLAIVTRLDSATLSATRAQLLDRVDKNLREQQHHLSSPSYDGRTTPYPQDVNTWADQLCWADLAVIDWLMITLQAVDIRAQLFAQADADHIDTATEHGGLVTFTEDRVEARAYPSARRGSDESFYSSAAMVVGLYSAGAHFHFHVRLTENAQAAGPGGVDRNLADRLEAGFIVLTFIDRHHLNVDYYQAGCLVIDLGTLTRPSEADSAAEE